GDHLHDGARSDRVAVASAASLLDLRRDRTRRIADRPGRLPVRERRVVRGRSAGGNDAEGRAVTPAARVRLIATAIAFTFLAGVVAIAVPRGDKGHITVTAYFAKAIGLFKDSHVRVLGVDVGRVTSVKPEGVRVKVTMTIDATRKIPADARAVIVPISLIADRYIQLT